VSAQDELLGKSPEALLVTLARQGHRDAFAELVRRREPWIRALMLRCCNDYALAEDLAQQAFVKAWRTIGQLRLASRFGPWLKRLAINEWLQHVRKSDPLEHADDVEVEAPESAAAGVAMDLDEALSTLKEHVRLCIVLSYHEGMTHDEIANFTGIALGTVKSHIRRGTQRLQELLAAYKGAPSEENST
jgi:RNA polymerase sigma-70 factor (ECF subfamily)